MCQHFKPIVPADWKAKYRGEVYDRYDVRNLIKETKLHQKGQCALNPVHVEVWTNHYCGQFIDDTESDSAKIPSLRIEKFIWGDNRSQYVKELEEQVWVLRRRLKTARARSAKRLQRLKQAKKTGT
jgi:hypothetical protein